MIEDENLDLAVRLQYLEALRLAAYQSFNDRRNYEWKLSLAIWTALAVLIAGLVQPAQAREGFPFLGIRYGIGATIVGVLILLLHIYFNNCMARANAIDKNRVRNYANQLESKLRLEDTILARRIETQIAGLPKIPESRWMQWWQWSHLVQIAITAVLTAVAVAFVWVRAMR